MHVLREKGFDGQTLQRDDGWRVLEGWKLVMMSCDLLAAALTSAAIHRRQQGKHVAVAR